MSNADNLIKFGDTWLPNEYLLADGYESTPNQRTELDAFRDANVLLHRVTSSNYKALQSHRQILLHRITSSNHKTNLSFTLCPLTLTDKQYVQSIINGGMENSTERKVLVTYWNDETNSYETGHFYIHDVTYQIMGYYGGERWYKSVTYELTEY